VSRGRAAGAGALAALVWASLEPLDRRLVGHDYSDVAVLGKSFTRGPAWPFAGLALHAANGAVFGLAARGLRQPPVRLALVEHVMLFPLGYVVDRVHPARGEPGLAPLFSTRAFVQATWRHLLFGAVLDRLTAQ
jgi:hypothetical protein